MLDCTEVENVKPYLVNVKLQTEFKWENEFLGIFCSLNSDHKFRSNDWETNLQCGFSSFPNINADFSEEVINAFETFLKEYSLIKIFLTIPTTLFNDVARDFTVDINYKVVSYRPAIHSNSVVNIFTMRSIRGYFSTFFIIFKGPPFGQRNLYQFKMCSFGGGHSKLKLQ